MQQVHYAPVETKEMTGQPEQKSYVEKKEEVAMNNDHSDNQDHADRSMEAPAASAPFQRPPQMQRSVPGNFGGTYVSTQGQSSGMYDSRGSSEDRRLVIGRGITMSGEIEACDYLLVEGTLEAGLKGAKVLEVAESGTFYGAVEIEEAMIAGRFEGELTVNGRITVKSGGSVTGTIAYKELAVEAGAVVDGKISPLASGMAQSAQPSQKKSMAPKNDNAGEQGGELPFSGNAAAAE
ncbi:MAG: polymer-forming cytoskeletal protein [Rhodospirillales bacterium]|nr:polymer-forming cytoskeletal protein [Rhodospirillales bacterium]MCB9995174.1 polymer-forming cytoskeletal protein [Rhodospirillales bacterium]